MASPVKVSDKLLALARQEAQAAHRSTTAQIEHWATLGRAVEGLVVYGDVLALKRVGQVLPIPPFVPRERIDDLLARLLSNPNRDKVKARIRAAGTPLYTTDPDYPGMIVEVQADGTRTPGALKHRRFVPAEAKRATRRK